MSISPKQELQAHSRRERRLWRAIREAHCEGKSKRAAYLQRRYLESYSARMIAGLRAYRSLRVKYRPTPENALGVVANTNPWAGSQEIVGIKWVPKASNPHEFRSVLRFGFEQRMLQYLTRECLAARADLNPNQYGIKGGLQKAILRVRDALQEGYKHAVELDISSCFPSVNGEHLHQAIPLPKEVITQTILTKTLNLYPINMWDQSPGVNFEDDPVIAESLDEARQGIAQGSVASNLVLETILAPIIGALSKLGVAVSYSDNVLLLAKTASDAMAMQKTLRDALRANPAGPLRLNKPKTYPAGTIVEFLGYMLRPGAVGWHIAPSRRNLQKFRATFRRKLKATVKKAGNGEGYDENVKKLRAYVISWTHAFCLWEEAQEARIKHLELINQEIFQIAPSRLGSLSE